MKKENIKLMMIMIIFISSYSLLSSFVAMGGEKVYKIMGTIGKISPDTITIESDAQVLNFDRHDAVFEVLKELKSGDLITVWYTLKPKKVIIGIQPGIQKQQPIQVNPFQYIIKDDRIYYDAINSDPEAVQNRNELYQKKA